MSNHTTSIQFMFPKASIPQLTNVYKWLVREMLKRGIDIQEIKV